MKFKKIVGKIHLWLGLSSGLVVFIVAVTGCIYAFQEEIQDMTQPYRFVEPENAPVLPPPPFGKKRTLLFLTNTYMRCYTPAQTEQPRPFTIVMKKTIIISCMLTPTLGKY